MNEEEKSLDLAKFHRWSKPDKEGNCYPLDTLDDEIVEEIIKDFDIFLLNGKLYRYIDGVYIMDEDGCIFKTMISKFIYSQLRTDTRISRIHKLLLTKYKIRIDDYTEINKYPTTWIPFRNGMLDVTNYKLHPHKPEYRCINQLPHDWNGDHKSDNTIVIDYLKGVIPDDADRQMFLQYIGYSFTTSTHLQKFLIICGEGGLGKSVLLRLTQWAIGKNNYSNLTLQNLNDRFSPAFLLGKLMNIYADLPSTDMGEINGIKTITGEDNVRAEYKGGKVFFFIPYCKLLYSANKIPKSKDDRTSAYYRRLLILRIRQRGSYIPDIEKQLSEHIDDFIHLVVDAVHDMYTKYSGSIQESQNSIDEVNELHKETDTIHAWITDNHYKKSDRNLITRIDLYRDYEAYCHKMHRDKGMVSNNGFYASLRELGFREIKSHGDYKFYIEQGNDDSDFLEIDNSTDLPF